MLVNDKRVSIEIICIEEIIIDELILFMIGHFAAKTFNI